jgi:hypothetical protein
VASLYIWILEKNISTNGFVSIGKNIPTNINHLRREADIKAWPGSREVGCSKIRVP